MIIDSRVIRATIGDDPTLIREAATDFLSSSGADMASITKAISASDAEGVRVASHSIKGASGIFGASELKHLCTELESAARDSNWSSIQALVPKLAIMLGEVEVAIGDYLERMP